MYRTPNTGVEAFGEFVRRIILTSPLVLYAEFDELGRYYFIPFG